MLLENHFILAKTILKCNLCENIFTMPMGKVCHEKTAWIKNILK